MKFLKASLRRLAGWFKTWGTAELASLGGPLEGRLGPSELVTRFIYTQKNIAKTRPRPNAFEPPADLELSTAHVTQLSAKEIWALALRTLDPRLGSNRKKVYARADLKVAAYNAQKLFATRDNDPFDRHTVVKGWPNPPEADERKSQIQAICLELCHAESLNMTVLEKPIVWGPHF